MTSFKNQQEYFSYLEGLGGLPEGFKTATASLTFLPNERPSEEPYRMNMAAITMDEPGESFAGVFTRNAVPGAPVLIGRNRLDSRVMQGVLINNRISNVAARGGENTALKLTAEFGSLLNIPGERIFPSSTGIIGWALPETEMIQTLPDLCRGMNNSDVLSLARAIMTTDSYPKIRVAEVAGARIVAVAKGAGMIEPNMATMLGFIMTDADVSRKDLRRILASVVEDSFNSISVDSDQSTSDMVLAFSSGKKKVDLKSFEEAFMQVCRDISLDIVRNGEGTGHVLRISVSGHSDSEVRRGIAKAVGNSPLVKTALYGNDPNVGRLLSAIGDYAGNNDVDLDISRLKILIGSEVVFENSVFHIDKEKEQLLSGYLIEQAQNPRITGYPQHDRCVELCIELGQSPGSQTSVIYASDLGHEYVTENADYRT